MQKEPRHWAVGSGRGSAAFLQVTTGVNLQAPNNIRASLTHGGLGLSTTRSKQEASCRESEHDVPSWATTCTYEDLLELPRNYVNYECDGFTLLVHVCVRLLGQKKLLFLGIELITNIAFVPCGIDF